MSLTAADVMTRKVATIGPQETLAQTAGIMAKRGVSAAPVCDEEGHVLGIERDRGEVRQGEVIGERGTVPVICEEQRPKA